MHAQAPQRILETTQPPSVAGTPRSETWAADVCGGNALLHSQYGPRYEWMPIVSGYGQYGSVEAVSGWALTPRRSDADLPFTHPFSKRDFDYFLLPDSTFDSLLAPGNVVNAGSDADTKRAKVEADAFHLAMGSGVIAVEQDYGLIPDAYKPRVEMADRVAVFGRWIIDCGHDNWQSEIHPPLLTAVARPNIASQLTRVDIVANPYLVDQEFEHGGILNQLEYELAMVNTPLPFVPFSARVKARAGYISPVKGLQVFSFRIRPPAPRTSSSSRLYVRMHLTARTGVIVQPFLVDSETVGVVGLFTDDFQVLKIPDSNVHDWDVSATELMMESTWIGVAYDLMIKHIGTTLGDPVKAGILGQGIRATLIDAPKPPDLATASVTEGWAESTDWGQNPVTVDNSQAFPLIGWIELQWRLPPSVLAQTVAPKGWAVVQRHLDEIHRSSGTSAEPDIIARTKAASALVTDVVVDTAARLSGKWRYRLQGIPGQPGEAGILWLRSSGSAVQGMIEGPQKRQDIVEGTVAEGGRVLRLSRHTPRGEMQRMILTRNGTTFAGTIVGTQRRMEMAPFL
jgi:hypothetical protein